jgi:anti-sigma regulatory factor (Ser/Thr protein kinase)
VLTDSASHSLHDVPDGFQHDACVYRDEDEFVRLTTPFLRDGLAAGEVVLAAVPPARIAKLRSALGAAADGITFFDMTAIGRNPARLIPLWRSLVDQYAGRPLRGIGEPAYPGRSEAELTESSLHEALINLAFADETQLRILCPYDASMVTSSVAATHSAELAPSNAEQVFRTRLPGVPEDADAIEFGLAELTAVRQWFAGRARSHELSGPRLEDLELALHEICTNSVRFGGGGGTLSLWSADGNLVLDVTDRGRIDDLLVGRVLPPVDGRGGRGVWLANQLCDLVQIRSGDGFTQVRLHTRLG